MQPSSHAAQVLEACRLDAHKRIADRRRRDLRDQEHGVLSSKLGFEEPHEADLAILGHDEASLIERGVKLRERETKLRQNRKILHLGSPDLNGCVSHCEQERRHFFFLLFTSIQLYRRIGDLLTFDIVESADGPILFRTDLEFRQSRFGQFSESVSVESPFHSQFKQSTIMVIRCYQPVWLVPCDGVYDDSHLLTIPSTLALDRLLAGSHSLLSQFGCHYWSYIVLRASHLAVTGDVRLSRVLVAERKVISIIQGSQSNLRLRVAPEEQGGRQPPHID